MAVSGGVLHSTPAKDGSMRKEIYRYTAPWTVFGMNWSVRQDKRFRLAIGSFIEDYCNKVSAPSSLLAAGTRETGYTDCVLAVTCYTAIVHVGTGNPTERGERSV